MAFYKLSYDNNKNDTIAKCNRLYGVNKDLLYCIVKIQQKNLQVLYNIIKDDVRLSNLDIKMVNKSHIIIGFKYKDPMGYDIMPVQVHCLIFINNILNDNTYLYDKLSITFRIYLNRCAMEKRTILFKLGKTINVDIDNIFSHDNCLTENLVIEREEGDDINIILENVMDIINPYLRNRCNNNSK